MLMRFRSGDASTLTPVAGLVDIEEAQRAAEQVRVDDTVREYLLTIIEATRRHRQLRLGASPRASLALQRAAQVYAAMGGRDYVLPDDVKALAAPVLSHRLVLDSAAQLRGQGRDAIVNEIAASVPVPIER